MLAELKSMAAAATADAGELDDVTRAPPPPSDFDGSYCDSNDCDSSFAERSVPPPGVGLVWRWAVVALEGKTEICVPYVI